MKLRNPIKRLIARLREARPPSSTAGSLPAEIGASATVNSSESLESTYSSDQPIGSEKDDKFNRWPFAKRIADTLAMRIDAGSLVIGIYGPWGDGKTSTLRLMERTLVTHANIVTVKFNPWYFGSDEQLLRAFFATLASAIGKTLPKKSEELGRLLERYGSLLSLASVSIGGVVQIGVGEAAKGLGKSLSAVELDELRTRLQALLRETGKVRISGRGPRLSS